MSDGAPPAPRRQLFDRTINVAGVLAIVAGAYTVATTGLGIRQSIDDAIVKVVQKNDEQDWRLKALEVEVTRSKEQEEKWREWARGKLEDQAKDFGTALRNLSVIEERTRRR